MLYYSLWLPIVLSAAFALRGLRFDRVSILVILGGIALYYFHFYHTHWGNFAIDHGPHTAYVEFIAQHGGLLPLPGTGAAFRHGPLYYVVASWLYRAAQAMGEPLPMMAVRHLSMALYITFIAFGALTLRRFAPERSDAFRAALGLLVFWPVGVTFGGRVTCDLLMYAAEMAVMYCLVRWVQGRHMAWIGGAFAASGFVLLAKNTGVLFLGLTALCLAFAAWQQRSNPRLLKSWPLWVALVFALECLYWSVSREWLFRQAPPATLLMAAPESLGERLRTFLWFDPVLFFDESIYNIRQAPTNTLFWHGFLRSMLLGQFFEWKALSVVFALGVAWMCILAFIPFGLALTRHGGVSERQGAKLLALIGAVMLGSLMAVRFLLRAPDYAEARYIYPIIAIILAFYALAMEWHDRAGNRIAVRIGRGMALAVGLLSVALFASQYYL